MKWQIIIIMLTLLMITGVTALDMCSSDIEINTPCTMLTPSITCDSYTYNMTLINTTTITSATLSPFNNQIYQFNITESAGDYIITLCDGTTREIRIEKQEVELKMIAIIIGFIFLIGLFIMLGFITNVKGLKLMGFGLAAIQTILLIGFMYGEYAGFDYTLMLRLNFIAMFIIIFLGGTLAMILYSMKTMTESEDETEGKWGRRWRK